MTPPIPTEAPIRLSDTLSLERGRVHEVMGAARDSFAVTLGAKLSGPIVWIGRGRDIGSLTPNALRAFIDPRRIVLTEGTTRKEILWAAEQVLRSKAADLVVIQLALGPDLTESRRLQLAAEQNGAAGGIVGLVLIEKRAQSSAAQTRWTCETLTVSEKDCSHHWLWEITKNKSGPVGRWRVRWTGDIYGTSGDVHMVAASAA